MRAAEISIFKEYLFNHTATCTMACNATGLLQKCATRYKRKLEKQGQLYEVKRGFCEVTGHRASYLSTKTEKVCCKI